MSQKCYNHHCGKELTEEDKTDFCGCFKERVFLECHLCNDCFGRFDSQKLAGRGRIIDKHLGIVTEDNPAASECAYTESRAEWVRRQGEDYGN